MSKNYWVLVAFVATMVCNGNCRPREVEIKDKSVYKSEKQLELENPIRYEKSYKEKPGDDSVNYHRIDIPYKSVNHLNTTVESTVQNSSKSVVDYVPVELTIKRPNIKKWPNGPNGIESPDDLSLYNVYTNNINPLKPHQTTVPYYNLDFPYTSHSQPSILILEELTTRKPFYSYDSVYTRPIQILDRPPSKPSQIYPVHVEISQSHPAQTTGSPEYSTTAWLIYKPSDNPSFAIPASPPYAEQNHYFPVLPVEYPNVGHESTTQIPLPEPPINVEPNPEQISIPQYVPTTLPPEMTTTNTKYAICPNVSITAATSINNSNSIKKKEGCQGINIYINTSVTNSNTGLVRPNKPTTSSVTVVQNDQTTQTGILGVFDVIWSIFSRFFNFSFFNPILSGALSTFPSFFAGLSAFVLPWFFPLLLQNSRSTRLGILENDEKHFRRFTEKRRYKRNSGEFRSQYMGWGTKKKISSLVSPTAEPEAKSEIENANKANPKLNIESIATVARASNDGAPLPPSASIGHMLDTVSQLMESDIRTPPKLKEIIKEKANEHRKEVLGENSTPLPYTFIYEDDIGKFEEKQEVTDKTLLVDSSEGKASSMNAQTNEGVKGIAIPVMMNEDYELTVPPKKLQKIPELPKPGKEEKKKTPINKSQPTTTPSSGLSTWILLSDNKDVTTPSPKKNNKKEEEKKKVGAATTTKKPGKIQSTTQKSTIQSNKKVTPKPSNKKSDSEVVGMSALEALIKNQKKGNSTTPKPKITDLKKKIPDKLIAETKDKADVKLSEYKTTYTLPPNLQIITTEDKPLTTTSSQSSVQMTTESSTEATTKKKSTTKKKKKNKNRRKKPAEDTGVEAKIPSQPVGSQIYNFLSREIVPTVGLGLIGVALTAGLASFLGYNPFGSSTIPLRRTYDTHHGYSSSNYYNYNTDYGDGGQSEEVLFREVLSGMPEDSRYGLTHTDASYSDVYNRQDQTYDGLKNPLYPTASGTMYTPDKEVGSYDSSYPQDYSTGYGTSYDTPDKYSTDVKEKYPVYTRETGTSFIYPETTGMTSADKTSRIDDYATKNADDKYSKTNSDTIERQPEALYRVASESDLQYRRGEATVQGVNSQNSWHRIGSPMESKKAYPVLEPGPRSLDFGKESPKTDARKRSKRAAESVIQRISRKRTKKENDVENEIDFDDSFSDSKFSEQNFLNDFSTTTSATKLTTVYAETTASADVSTIKNTVSVTENVKEMNSTESTDAYEPNNDSTVPPPSGVSVLDVLKRLAQFKLRLGLNFLRSTTDLFSRYLDDIQRRVDESFANTTTTTVQYNRRKSPWSRIFFSRHNSEDDDESYRRKRSVLENDQFFGAMLNEEHVTNDRFSKSTKKDLRLSNKIFHLKKNSPKKYESKLSN